MKTIYQKTIFDSQIKTYQVSAETELSFIGRLIYEWDDNRLSGFECAFSKSQENERWFFSIEALKEKIQKEKAEKIAEIEKKYAV